MAWSATVTGDWRARFAALRVAVHPAHVEPVAWIAGSTDVNCALMVFLSLVAWSRSRRERLAERSGAAWLALTGGLFALAMLCIGRWSVPV